ncbi:MAG TPA: MerR family transcriptional regulator [Chloroflexota bacterium]|nr:MerR family transcriptional regulator [Chloroflexota bacterium]
MPYSEFRFQAPNRRRIWKELSLTMSQAAALAGVSERQIQHWMDKGYISPGASGSRKIDGGCLDLIILIKQARAAGIPLRHAVPMAQSFLVHEGPGALDGEMASWALRDLRDRLAAALAGIEAVQAILDEVVDVDARSRIPDLPALAGDRVS